MFDGAVYSDKQDRKRLLTQLERVLDAMSDGHWHTLKEMGETLDESEASISAQMRNARKERFGSRIIECHRVPGKNGLCQYRLLR